MAHYVKLFGSLLDSTVWAEPPAIKIVWITMLAMADRDGLVEASIPGLAKRAGVSREDCEKALTLFQSPDPDSRTKEHEGRRIREVDGGWSVLNYEKYRDKATAEEARQKNAARQKRWRQRNGIVTRRVTHVTPVDQNNVLSSSSSSSSSSSVPRGGRPPVLEKKSKKFPREALSALKLIEDDLTRLKENGERGPDGKLAGKDAEEWKRLWALKRENKRIALEA